MAVKIEFESARICFVAIGTRGDVQPILVAIKKLLDYARIHQFQISPMIITHELFLPWLENVQKDYQFEIRTLPGDFEELIENGACSFINGDGVGAARACIANPDYVKCWLGSIVEFAFGSDLLVCGFTSCSLCVAAGDILQVPVAKITLQPEYRTCWLRSMAYQPTDFEWNYYLDHPKLSELEQFDHVALEHWDLCSKYINDWRTEHELNPLLREQVLQYINYMATYNIYSPLVVPPPKDWPPWVQSGGYLFLDLCDQPPLSSTIVDFLGAGDAPVYIGFGSMPVVASQKLVPLLQDLLIWSSQRFIVFIGGMDPNVEHVDDVQVQMSDKQEEWNHLVKTNGCPTNRILFIRSCSHMLLFPRCKAIMFHCGAGTTGTALISGRPLVPVPLSLDQPFWANTVHRLGVAAPPVLFKNATGKLLAYNIELAIQPHVIERAKYIGKRIRMEEGGDRIAKWLIELVLNKN